MNDATFKRTRRQRDDDTDDLEALIVRKRNVLVQARMEAPLLRQRATALRAAAAAMTRRHQVRARNDMYASADALCRDATRREGMHEEFAFEQNVVTYLRTYYTTRCHRPAKGAITGQPTATKLEGALPPKGHVNGADAKRDAITNEFITEYGDEPPKVVMAVRDECPRCDGGKKLLHCTTQSILTCPVCGYAMTYLDATCASLAFDDAIDLSQYSYKKINHYTMHLALCQGKEAHRVPNAILQVVMKDLYERQGIRAPEAITYRNVREAIRRNRIRKAYDHVVQITARIKGVRPPRLSGATEKQLKNMFLQMQPVFLRHAPSSRTNFLSYTYVLYRCFQILGLTHMLDTIVLLKGRAKLEANDEIFRLMCEDLGWPVHELPRLLPA